MMFYDYFVHRPDVAVELIDEILQDLDEAICKRSISICINSEWMFQKIAGNYGVVFTNIVDACKECEIVLMIAEDPDTCEECAIRDLET